MPALDYIESFALGANVTRLTGIPVDGLSAGGYSAWIHSITGKAPTVVPLPNRRAKLILSREQIVLMQKWFDTQLKLSLSKPAKPPSLEIAFGPVFLPWMMKYTVPLAVLLIASGWLAHWYLAR